MSIPFTSVSSLADWPKADWPTLLDEIIVALVERLRVKNYNWSASVQKLLNQICPEGADVQATHTNEYSWNFWIQIQFRTHWLLTSHTINHVSGPLNADQTDFLMFTDLAFRTAAGLDTTNMAAGGCFRRAREWIIGTEPTWEYGYMQKGDIIGPWIIEDLQKALSTMRWTVGAVSSLSSSRIGGNKEGQDDGVGTCEDRLALYNSAWTNSVWGEEATNDTLYLVSAYRLWYDNPSRNWFSGDRRRGKGRAVNICTDNPHSADCYFLPTAEGTWRDLDNTGLTKDKFVFYQSFGEAKVAERIASQYGNIDTSPIALAEWGCPYQSGKEIIGMKCSSHWVIKWNFTNSG